MSLSITEDAEQDFMALGVVMKARVRDIYDRLEKWPEVSGVRHLKRSWKGHSRIRSGRYRVVFRVDGNDVTVVKIDDRGDVYEGR